MEYIHLIHIFLPNPVMVKGRLSRLHKLGFYRLLSSQSYRLHQQRQNFVSARGSFLIPFQILSNWKEFEKGLENFHAPTQSFVFADADGTIAMKANGKIPIYEDGTDALLPLPGWEEKYVLDEYIPFDELPTVINPEK